LSWIDKLVDNIKTIFVDLYGDQLRKPNTTIVECHFEEYFEQQIQRLEKTTLNQEPRAAEFSTILEERPLVFAGSSGDEPPPLPGLLSRGWYRMLEFDD
jgi:signal recognition particle receptor subunit alpha